MAKWTHESCRRSCNGNGNVICFIYVQVHTHTDTPHRYIYIFGTWNNIFFALSHTVMPKITGHVSYKICLRANFPANCMSARERKRERRRYRRVGNARKTVPVITFIASTFNIEWMARKDFLFEINNSISFAFQWQHVPDQARQLHLQRDTV